MESEVNETAGVENTSNVTGRDAATPEGIAITYGSLFLMALLPLFFGSLRSVGYHTGLKVGNKVKSLLIPQLKPLSVIDSRRRSWRQDRNERRSHVPSVCQRRALRSVPLLQGFSAAIGHDCL